jgi:hypothetical protein
MGLYSVKKYWKFSNFDCWRWFISPLLQKKGEPHCIICSVCHISENSEVIRDQEAFDTDVFFFIESFIVPFILVDGLDHNFICHSTCLAFCLFFNNAQTALQVEVIIFRANYTGKGRGRKSGLLVCFFLYVKNAANFCLF